MRPQRASVLEETGADPEARREKPILWAITGGNQQLAAFTLAELICAELRRRAPGAFSLANAKGRPEAAAHGSSGRRGGEKAGGCLVGRLPVGCVQGGNLLTTGSYHTTSTGESPD